MPLKLVVLISGTGSNLRALLEATQRPGSLATVVAVGADREAPGLDFATERGIPTFVVAYEEFDSRARWGDALLEAVAPYDPDLVILSGLMRLLPERVVAAWSPAVLNTHPAYLPEFPGAHGVRDALAAGVRQTGASIIVVNDGVDEGPVLARERVPVFVGDTEASLHERIKPVERRLLAEVIFDIAQGRINLEEYVSQ